MTVLAVDRCLSLLETLAERPEGVPLSELADRLDQPLSAVHRMLTTLAARGYVRQDPLSHAYGFTLRLAALGFRFLDARHLPDAAQGVLDGLAAETGDYCRLALAEGDGLTWVARAQGARQGLRYDPPMGRGVILHATATGKAWLATLPEHAALRLVYAQGFPIPIEQADHVFGRNVATTVDELRAALTETRRRGYALAEEEGEPGTVAVAVAFRAGPAQDAPALGTLSVAGPLVRLPPSRYPDIATALHGAGRELAAIWPLRQRQAGDRF